MSFVGTVRDRHDGALLDALELEHYPGMTEASIEAMIDEATRRFDIRAARVVHRVGRLEPLAQIVLVAVAAAHRGQAFEACEFLMDYLKTQAPFWKKETGTAGARWVDARSTDDAALARWGIAAPERGRRAASADDALARDRRGLVRRGRRRAAALGRGHLAQRALAGFPLGTLFVNCVGGLVIGAVLFWLERSPNELLRLLLVTGLLGGFTTFSAFSAESLIMLQRGELTSPWPTRRPT